jgi:hypothetical protein
MKVKGKYFNKPKKGGKMKSRNWFYLLAVIFNISCMLWSSAPAGAVNCNGVNLDFSFSSGIRLINTAYGTIEYNTPNNECGFLYYSDHTPGAENVIAASTTFTLDFWNYLLIGHNDWRYPWADVYAEDWCSASTPYCGSTVTLAKPCSLERFSSSPCEIYYTRGFEGWIPGPNRDSENATIYITILPTPAVPPLNKSQAGPKSDNKHTKFDGG